MLRILTGFVVLGMLLSGIAWADDYDIIDETDSPEYAADDDHTHVEAGEPVAIDPDNMGMYFGTGDELISGFQQADGTFYTTREFYTEDTSESVGYHDDPIFYPGHHDGEGYGADNVYGPMWGVPSDAAGTEYWDPHMYDAYSADPSLVQHNHDNAEAGEASTVSEEGLNISSSDSY